MLCINIGLEHKIMHYMKPFASVIDIKIYLKMQLWCTTRSLLKLYCNTNINMIIKITTINRIMNRPILKRPPSELDWIAKTINLPNEKNTFRTSTYWGIQPIAWILFRYLIIVFPMQMKYNYVLEKIDSVN